MSIDDYDILSILGNNINSTTYKVKHKESGKLFVWKNVEYESNNDKEYLLDKIRKRIDTYHPNIIKFHNYINHKENKNIYIVIEYCEHGSLKNIINSCLVNNTHLSEELMCKIFYQIALTMKTTDCYIGKLTINEIFLDEHFNVKLLNFKFNHNKDSLKEAKICCLGLILYEICTFKSFSKHDYSTELKRAENTFSHSLLSLIKCLIKDTTELRKNINKVLCHPTVLLKAAQWIKEKSFVDIKQPKQVAPLLKDINSEDDTIINPSKLEKLHIKETSLQIREQQLNEWEYKLIIKEKKIASMERTVKEKLQQAELHLKRCRGFNVVSSESTKSTISSHPEKKMSYEDLDSTYVSCGDSILLPTSSKLNVNKIVKPAPFTRTLSERRIRFKGHSPLKDMDFNRRKSVKQSKSQKGILLKKNSDWLTCSEDTDKSSIDESSKGTISKAKKLFSTKNTYENGNLANCDVQCKPITWTEENKKHAFELLRVMNNDKENQCLEVKHTYL